MLNRLGSMIRHVRTQLKRRDFLIAYLTPFLAFVLFVVAVFLFWFHYSVHEQIRQNITQSAQARTDTAATNLDHLFTGLTAQAKHMSDIEELTPSTFVANHYKAYDKLTAIYYRPLNYTDMAIIYRDSEWMLAASGTCLRSTYLSFPESERMVSDLFSTKEKLLLNTLDYGASGNGTLIYAQRLPVSTYRHRYSILFTFDYHTVVELLYLDELYASDSTPIMAIYDSSGHCIWNNSKNWQAFEESVQPYATGKAVSSVLNLNHQEYLVTSTSVSNGFLKLVSLEQTMSSYNDTLNAALIMMLACIVLIILFGVYSLYRVFVRCYKPVEQALSSYRTSLGHEDEKSELEILSHFSSLNYDEYAIRSGHLGISKEQLQSMFVLATLKRQFINQEDLVKLQRNLDIDFPHPYYFVCCFLFDSPISLPVQHEMIAVFQSANHSGAVGYYSMMPDSQTLVGIINISASERNMQLGYLNRLQTFYPIFTTATIAVGNCYDSLLDTGKSYLESCSAMDYRLINGRNSLLFYSDLAQNSSNLDEYPTQLMQAYPRLLHTWNVEAISMHLNKIQNYIAARQISLQQVKCICYELLNGFLNEVRTLDAGNIDEFNSICDVFSIVEFDSMNGLIQKIHILTQRICEYMDQIQSSRNRQFLQQCMEFMEENITNPQFTLESIADHFDITPQTLRSRFKQLTGKTLIDAMKKLRLERACLLLETTDLDINQIIANVGYLDASSFSRLFKKETGLTPSEYRIQRGSLS